MIKQSFLFAFLTLSTAWAHAGAFEDFFVAAKRDVASSIAQLIRRGFDANTLDEDGNSALLIAVREPSPKVVQLLLTVPKLNVNLRNKTDETPLMLAALKGHAAWAQALIALDADVNKPGWAPLHYAATAGDLAMLRMLLDKHAYIDAESPNKSTPLMMAAMYGSDAAVKLLLEEGADASLKNEQGLTALDFAVRAQRSDTEAALKNHVQPKAQLPKGRW